LNDEEGDQEDGGGHRPKTVLRRIFVKGREDHTRADIMGMTWRRSLLREGTKIKQQELLLHLLFGSPIREPDLQKAGLLEAQSVALMEKPWLDGFSIIEEKEASKKLNESQARAARAILSPLVPKPFGKAAGAESTNNSVSSRCPADRLILVHGPPGTGKTSLITACCQQFVQATEIDVMLPAGVQVKPKKEIFESLDTIYACCQSNVAVKNIGESLSRNGVDFRIVVSPNFYVEWHEDLYDDIKGRLITTDNLPVGVEALSKQFAGCQVILSTLAFLSGQKFAVDNPLRKLRPMRLLMVDEASQIHIRQYPHLLDAYGHQLARIVFFGDDRQLAPFSSESSSELGISVFELDHLRPKAFMLDTCYRLPKPMVEFISDKVYDGKVRVGPSNFNPQGGLSDCVAFIDVKSSQECREGKSRKNAAEVAVVLALLTSYKEAGGDMKVVKVLTTYDAQREALQRALKHAGLSGDADLVFSVDAFQ
jgi:regulator of nonsense transcripts 1